MRNRPYPVLKCINKIKEVAKPLPKVRRRLSTIDQREHRLGEAMKFGAQIKSRVTD